MAQLIPALLGGGKGAAAGQAASGAGASQAGSALAGAASTAAATAGQVGAEMGAQQFMQNAPGGLGGLIDPSHGASTSQGINWGQLFQDKAIDTFKNMPIESVKQPNNQLDLEQLINGQGMRRF